LKVTGPAGKRKHLREDSTTRFRALSREFGEKENTGAPPKEEAGHSSKQIGATAWLVPGGETLILRDPKWKKGQFIEGGQKGEKAH